MPDTTDPGAEGRPCGDTNPGMTRCFCHLPDGHHGPHAHADGSCGETWPNLNENSPCFATEVAVLGVVGDPARLRCGQREGHHGKHRFVIEWEEGWPHDH